MNTLTRRNFVKAGTSSAICMPSLLQGKESAKLNHPMGKAEHVISIWLGGGMGQIDTFDPKRKGVPKEKIPGSYYDAINTAVPGVQLCEHLPRVAPLMDRVTAVRTVNHKVIDEHAAATNFMHTGRPISGTVTYPSIGSLIAHERGPADESAPAYVLIGYPNVTRGPGFLGSKHGYLYLTDTSQGPAGLSRPKNITTFRQDRRNQLLANLRNSKEKPEDSRLAGYEDIINESIRLSGPSFNRAFELDKEPALFVKIMEVNSVNDACSAGGLLKEESALLKYHTILISSMEPGGMCIMKEFLISMN